LDTISLSMLFGILVFLILASGFFSGSETGLMSLNRYRLRNLANKNHKGAQKAQRLLERPERIIGMILLGNNFVNILAATIASIIGIRLLDDAGPWVSTIVLTCIILIFAEVTPKTIAALHPEKYALPSAYILEPLLKLSTPFVWLINKITKAIFKLIGISAQQQSTTSLSSEEIRIVVNEASSMIPKQHQRMLISILDLEKVTVEDIMVPRSDVTGIDIEDDWNDIRKQLASSQHTRLPVYAGDIDHIIGIIHIRSAINLFQQEEDNKDNLRSIINEAYFVPISTPLHTQLLNFQKEKRRIALVVNEYGDIQGIVTLEDILEEIVGEFTSDPAANIKDVHKMEDGSYLVDGSASIRELNRLFEWALPTDGPKTINGLIIEYLETIPEPGTSMLIADHPIEIVHTTKNTIKTVHINLGWKTTAESTTAPRSEDK